MSSEAVALPKAPRAWAARARAPISAPALDSSSSRLLESFERRVDDIGTSVAGPVLSLMQGYPAYGRRRMRGQVLENARRFALLTLETTRAGRPPLQHELEFARQAGANRVTAAPLAAVLHACELGTRIIGDWIANQADSDPRELRVALTLTRACFDNGRAAAAAVVEGYLRQCELSEAWSNPDFLGVQRVPPGYAPEAMDELLIRVVAADSVAARCLVRLTLRERELLDLVAQGCSNKQIALRLQISLSTTKEYVGRILEKTSLPNRAAVAATCARTPR